MGIVAGGGCCSTPLYLPSELSKEEKTLIADCFCYFYFGEHYVAAEWNELKKLYLNMPREEFWAYLGEYLELENSDDHPTAIKYNGQIVDEEGNVYLIVATYYYSCEDVDEFLEDISDEFLVEEEDEEEEEEESIPVQFIDCLNCGSSRAVFLIKVPLDSLEDYLRITCKKTEQKVSTKCKNIKFLPDPIYNSYEDWYYGEQHWKPIFLDRVSECPLNLLGSDDEDISSLHIFLLFRYPTVFTQFEDLGISFVSKLCDYPIVKIWIAGLISTYFHSDYKELYETLLKPLSPDNLKNLPGGYKVALAVLELMALLIRSGFYKEYPQSTVGSATLRVIWDILSRNKCYLDFVKKFPEFLNSKDVFLLYQFVCKDLAKEVFTITADTCFRQAPDIEINVKNSLLITGLPGATAIVSYKYGKNRIYWPLTAVALSDKPGNYTAKVPLMRLDVNVKNSLIRTINYTSGVEENHPLSAAPPVDPWFVVYIPHAFAKYNYDIENTLAVPYWDRNHNLENCFYTPRPLGNPMKTIGVTYFQMPADIIGIAEGRYRESNQEERFVEPVYLFKGKDLPSSAFPDIFLLLAKTYIHKEGGPNGNTNTNWWDSLYTRAQRIYWMYWNDALLTT